MADIPHEGVNVDLSEHLAVSVLQEFGPKKVAVGYMEHPNHLLVVGFQVESTYGLRVGGIMSADARLSRDRLAADLIMVIDMLISNCKLQDE